MDVWLQDELNHPSLIWMNHAFQRSDRPPVVSIVHHLRSSEDHPRVAGWVYRQIERAYLKTVDAFIFNSQTTRQVVEKLVRRPVKGIVAYPAGDRFGQGLSLEDIELRTGARRPLRILFVGNLIRRKGLDTLLSGLGLIKNEDWTLRVVGRMDIEPDYTEGLQALVQREGLSGRVEFLGNLPEEQLASEWRNAHILAVISAYEGFGIVYLEGMSFGLPAIGSTSGAAREIIRDGQNGRLVPAGDPAAAASAIRAYCRDRTLLLSHSINARFQFDRFPGWVQTTAHIRNFLVEISAR